MPITGIDGIVYGVEETERCRTFFADWGLREVAPGRFATLDGTEVVLASKSADHLLPAIEDGATLREVTWGTSDQETLDALRARLAAAGTAVTDTPDGFTCLDPVDLPLRFRITRRRKVAVQGTPSNTIDQPRRIDTASPVYERAEPVGIGHVVLFVPEVEPVERFYVDLCGFHVSDRYPGRGVFLRCRGEGGHHDLFLLKSPHGRAGLNHVAFTVRDLHEVFGGGLHMSRKGWESHLGPGRHPISSAFFWYVKSPSGGMVEYYADDDYLTEKWQPREFVQSPEIFAEWAVAGGIDGNTRRQSKG